MHKSVDLHGWLFGKNLYKENNLKKERDFVQGEAKKRSISDN